MYHDGMIGNLGIIQILASHTTGFFNSMLPKGKQPYKLRDIIPSQYEYLYPPLSEQDKKNKTNQDLINFVKSKPRAPQELFKDK